MRLYHFPHSPYCIPIALLLRNAGIAFEEVVMPVWDRRAVIELTGGACYQVPVLEHDGRAIFDTTDEGLVVARHVDSLVATDLFPIALSGIHELVIAHFEGDLEGTGFKLVDPWYLTTIDDLAGRVHAIRHKERKFGRGCVEAWAAGREELMGRFLAMLARFEGALTSNPFLFGERPVYADYALYGVLGNFLYCPHNRLDPAMFGWLLDWRERLERTRV